MLKRVTKTVMGWKADLLERAKRPVDLIRTRPNAAWLLGFVAEMTLLWVLVSFFGTPPIPVVLGFVCIHIWYTPWSSRVAKTVLLGCAGTAALFCLAVSAFDAGHCQSVNPGSDLHCEFVLHANE